jgi:hypothetical protein
MAESRIVVLGATGATGSRVAAALVRDGARPVLVGRQLEKLEALCERLGDDQRPDVELRQAEVEDPASIADALRGARVVVNTVGPFSRHGDAVVEAAIASGAHYLDSNGEPPFARRVFEHHGPAAAEAGVALLTTFGPEWVLGNAAGALAMNRAGAAAVRVDTGYFLLERDRSGSLGAVSVARTLSGTSLASGVDLAGGENFSWRDGRCVPERWAERHRRFQLDGVRLTGVSTGGSEHLALPRVFPQLREVNVYLGWFSPLSRLPRAAGRLAPMAQRAAWIRAVALRLARTRGAPAGEKAQRRVRSLTIATAHDAEGAELARVVLEGPDLYTVTAELLAWGARRVADRGIQHAGAVGSVDGFGLDATLEACAAAGCEVRSAT